MATITDIKRRILELSPAPFQEFCDTLLSKKGYGIVHGLGMKAGTGNTTIGNPDTYFRNEKGKYVLVAYTIQQSNIFKKLKEDIDKCFDSINTGLDLSEIDEIICCHTSANLSAGNDKKLHDYCKEKGISLTIWGIDEIANLVHNNYRSMAKDFLGLSIDTNQILSSEDFIRLCDDNGMSAPLNTIFQYRVKEKAEITNALENNSIVIVSGQAGVGKTRLVLESARDYADKNHYKLLCVKSNYLGLYEDLVSSVEMPGKYFFFVDDANELSQLNQILEYTTKVKQGYKVKVIATVRDYAKDDVITSAKKYSLPKMIKISKFTDEEIKGFLDKNLEIRNESYVNQIIHIAEGNPRIAYMAGKLAKEEKNLSSIRNVSELYDTYYHEYVDKTFGTDRDFCFVAGVLSIVNAVLLNNMSNLEMLLDMYDMNTDEFKDKIFKLARLEFVEIKSDQVAIFSDQCLANYMIYYVFFKEKIIPLSKVLTIGYKFFRKGMIRAINTILNLFESKETRNYCEQEILKTWDILKQENHPCYEDFVSDFHVFRPEESFIMAHEKIERMEKENFIVFNVDFSNNAYDENHEILTLFSGYQYSNYLDCVMELLLDYVSKNNKTMVSGYKWLENCYGIKVDDSKYGYFNQEKISDYLLQEVLKGNVNAMSIGFQWAKYSLGFLFESTEMGRGNTFVFYRIELKQSEGLDEYRKDCWQILLLLATKDEWKDKVILFLGKYSRNIHYQPDNNIVKNDLKYADQLLSTLKCSRILFLKSVKRLIIGFEKFGVEYKKSWDDIFSTEGWKLYQVLENEPFLSNLEIDEYISNRESRLSEYGKSLKIDDIKIFIQTVNNILSDSLMKQELFDIKQAIELIVQTFDKSKSKEFLKNFVLYGNNVSVSPCTILRQLNLEGDSDRLLEILKNSEFPQKNEWMFNFFDTLPEREANSQMLDELLLFLRDDSDKYISSSSCRRLRLLDKFLKIEPNVYPITTSIIFEKRHYSEFMIDIYFELLFNDGIYSPTELLLLYKNNLNLLQEIYFFMYQKESQIDYNGTFLVEFLSQDETWLKKYVEVFWKDDNDKSQREYDVLWKSNDFIKIFDNLLYGCPKEKLYKWNIGNVFKELLINNQNDEIVRSNIEKWIIHIVKENAKNEWIENIFSFICQLDDVIKRTAIKTFLECNSDFEIFDKLYILPTSWSWSGSCIPMYQKQIDFLKSLSPFISGVKFLKHKAKIKNEIEHLKNIIKQEEVDEIYRNLYM